MRFHFANVYSNRKSNSTTSSVMLPLLHWDTIFLRPLSIDLWERHRWYNESKFFHTRLHYRLCRVDCGTRQKNEPDSYRKYYLMSAYLLELGNCLPQLLKTKELPIFYKVSNCNIVSVHTQVHTPAKVVSHLLLSWPILPDCLNWDIYIAPTGVQTAGLRLFCQWPSYTCSTF